MAKVNFTVDYFLMAVLVQKVIQCDFCLSLCYISVISSDILQICSKILPFVAKCQSMQTETYNFSHVFTWMFQIIVNPPIALALKEYMTVSVGLLSSEHLWCWESSRQRARFDELIDNCSFYP